MTTDGPIREPGDTAPRRNDVYSAAELADKLHDVARELGQRYGLYELAEIVSMGADELEYQLEENGYVGF